MIKGVYHAAAGMLPRMNQQETVGNNLANVNTSGFKSDKRYFRMALDNMLLQGGQNGMMKTLSDDEFSLLTDFSQGSLTETKNPFDLAIHGEGFFCLETEDTVSYTRNGSFSISAEGEIINSQGYKLLSEDGPIRIVGRNVSIMDDGTVLVDGQNVSKIKVTDFEQPYSLKRNGYGYFVPENPEDEGNISEHYQVKQGFLENSNVDPIAEMLQMIELNRNYESCQKAIHSQDDTLRLAVNEIAK